MVVAIGVGVLVGALAARFRDTALDVGGRLLGILLYAAPIFWLGILLQLLFSIRAGLAAHGRAHRAAFAGADVDHPPVPGRRPPHRDWEALGSALRYLALPAVTLGLVIGGIVVRLVRVNMLQTLRSDYVEAARARGIGERRVLFGHALRNALVPVVTIVGLQFALLLSGAVLTEATFTWPGIGLSLYQFLQNRDYTAVQGIVTFYALLRGGRQPGHRRGRRPGSTPGSGTREPLAGPAGGGSSGSRRLWRATPPRPPGGW